MSSSLIELWSAYKSLTKPFKKKSLYSPFVKDFDTLPKQKLYEFFLPTKFCICFTKVNIILFLLHQCYHNYYQLNLRLILKRYFVDYQHDVMPYYQHQKLELF